MSDARFRSLEVYVQGDFTTEIHGRMYQKGENLGETGTRSNQGEGAEVQRERTKISLEWRNRAKFGVDGCICVF